MMTMSAKLKKSVVIFAMTAILLSFVFSNLKIAFSNYDDGKIDLFTQKEPYSGKGPNVQSDAFGPDEEVQIYGLVTYKDYPVGKNFLVAFQILGPPNPVENISFCRVAFTDEMGVAMTSFRTSHLNETAFGEWTVIGNTKIADLTFEDTVSFKVGWIIEIVSLKTVNENHMEQEGFPRGNFVGIKLALRNIAMTEKKTTLAVTIYDYLGTYVNATELNNFAVQPNETLVYTYLFLFIPKSAYTGRATVYACAYTALPSDHGVPYCPEVSKYFLITSRKYFLKVATEPAHVTTILGEGWYEENVNIRLTATSSISVLKGVRYNFSFWDVDGLSQGLGINSIDVFMDTNHTATAHYILQYYLTVNSLYGNSGGEGWYNSGTLAYTTLNIGILDHENETRRVFTNWSGDASGTYYTQSNPIIMDAPKTAIANWKTQYYLTVRTDPPEITAITGEGWYDDSSNITINAPAVSGYDFGYWDVNCSSQGSEVGTITVHMNAPQTATAHYTQIIRYTLTIVTVEGGTTDPEPGTYNYIANSTVQVIAIPNANYVFDHWKLDDMDVGSASSYIVTMDRNHTLTAVFSKTSAAWFVSGWFYWFLLPIILVIIFLIIWFYRGKRSKEAEQPFYKGWTAWYYCYDLRSETKI